MLELSVGLVDLLEVSCRVGLHVRVRCRVSSAVRS